MFNIGNDNPTIYIIFTLIIWVFAFYFFYYTISSFKKDKSIYLKLLYAILTFLYVVYAVILTQSTFKKINEKKSIKSKGIDIKKSKDDDLEDDDDDDDDDVEFESDNDDNDNKKQTPIRTFRTKQETKANKKSTLTYQELIKMYKSDDFIDMYVNSLRSMFTQKIKDYRKNLSDVRKNISELSYTNHSGKTDHGPLERAKQLRDEIKLVLKVLKQRLETMSHDSVRKDLEKALFDKKSGIDSLMGREDIKDFLALQIFTFARNPNIFAINFQNIAIYGPSGVGKTKVGETIAYVYSKSGILVRQKINIITKTDLTNMYINGSADVTRKHVNSSLEGILINS